MTSRNYSGNTVEASLFTRQLDSQPTRLPLQKGSVRIRDAKVSDASPLALVILTTARRRGIGRALIATAEKHFAERGIMSVALDTRLTREDACLRRQPHRRNSDPRL